MRYFLGLILIGLFWGPAFPCYGNWSLNVGYHNPPAATVGINFLYRGSKLGFEAGIGWVNADAYVEDDDDDSGDENNSNNGENDEDDETGANIAVTGDIDLKYFFSGRGVSPYLQAGFGTGIHGEIGDDNGASAGLGSPYAGIGVMAGSELYLYLSANANTNQKLFFQAGLGFDI